MKKFLLATAIVLGLALSAHAQTTSPLGCFARVYDRQHLAQHPDQIVTAVKLKIYPSPDDHAIWFAIQIQRRGEDKTLHSTGACQNDGETMRCYVECDGGGVRVTPRSNSIILMRLGAQPPLGPHGEPIKQDERIRMTSCGTQDQDDGSGIDVSGGKDDHSFLLTRTDDAVCVGIER